ncbi:MAG: MipA/OmpV family protein [Gammaproteobacteria bacterium]|nr:MipA/OmpV family protein [Gammaproteobacteria bacterium]
MNKLLPALLLLVSFSAYADHVPGHAKLELGAGLFLLSAPDFIGSTSTQTQLLPFPFIKYRGERFSIDDGVEARLLKTPDLLLSISGNGTLPSSSGNAEREGMDILDATAEFGPSLEYRLTHNEDTSIWLEIPLRFAFSIGENTGYIGQVFNPKVAWRRPGHNKYDWKLRLATGLLYSDADYHSYYYNVTEKDALPDRPVYTADKGYTGSRTEFTYSRRFDKLWLGGFVRYDNLNSSVIEDSPLVSVSSNWTAGIALAWIFFEK